MPDEFARGRLGGFSFLAGEGKSSSLTGWLGLPRLQCSPPAHLRLTRLWRVAHAQGGLTLRSEEGQLGAER